MARIQQLTCEKAAKFIEGRRQGFIKRHDIALHISIHHIGDARTAWKVKWLGDSDQEMTRIESIQHRLADKAIKQGLDSLTTDELIDYLDVEELWWFLDSGVTEDFMLHYAPVIQAILAKLEKRGGLPQ